MTVEQRLLTEGDMRGRTATAPSKLRLGTISALALCGQIGLAQAQGPAPLPVKVVVVTMFELGEDTGDRPGEFQTWVERLPLPEHVPFPQGHRDLRYSPEKGVLGLVTGIGTARSASSVMALGMDPRFDLTRAYWLVAGIAGADPNDMSIGSAAWAEWVVDGDLSHEIDPREAPEGWPTGYTPLRRAEPYAQPVPEDDEGVVYHLDPGLVGWAYRLTKDVELADADALRRLRQRYVGHPKAQEPPKVIRGDNLAAMTFWHGRLLNDWANGWTAYWTRGRGDFVTTAMEDSGTLQALTWLGKAGRVDPGRVLVLRTASNYSMQHAGITAAESLSGEKKGGYSAYLPSLEAAYRVGGRVVEELTANWQRYAEEPPSGG
jgi:purine nucleoside permease